MTIPPLLQIIEGRRACPRKTPVIRPREIALHIDVAHTLRRHCLPEWLWWHTPNGEKRDARTAAKLKQMGVRPGVPDFVLICPKGQLRCLELKRGDEPLGEAQQEFKFHCIAHNIPHCVARSMADVLTIFEHWGCLKPLPKGGEQ